MYTPNRFLEKAVQSGNAFTVRSALTGIIQSNPKYSREETYNAISYAEEHGIQVYEAETNPDLEMTTDRSLWDLEYYAKAVNYLQENFTKDRLEHVLQVAVATHRDVKAPIAPNAPRVPTMPTSEVTQLKKAPGHLELVLILLGIVLVALLLVKLVSHNTSKTPSNPQQQEVLTNQVENTPATTGSTLSNPVQQEIHTEQEEANLPATAETTNPEATDAG